MNFLFLNGYLKFLETKRIELFFRIPRYLQMGVFSKDFWSRQLFGDLDGKLCVQGVLSSVLI